MSPKDVALKLVDASAPFTNTTATTPVLTEGGFRADVRAYLGTITDADEVMTLNVQAAIDGGSVWHNICTFPGFIATHDGLEIARSCYVPRPQAGQTHTRVRLQASSIAGTTPSFPISAWLEPLVSLAVGGGEDQQLATLNRGLAALKT